MDTVIQIACFGGGVGGRNRPLLAHLLSNRCSSAGARGEVPRIRGASHPAISHYQPIEICGAIASAGGISSLRGGGWRGEAGDSDARMRYPIVDKTRLESSNNTLRVKTQ
jgi:hypothetical protein